MGCEIVAEPPLDACTIDQLSVPGPHLALKHTGNTVRAEDVGALCPATARTFVKGGNVLQCLSGHLPVALLHMRRLLLWHGTEDGLPDVRDQRRDGDGNRGQEEC